MTLIPHPYWGGHFPRNYWGGHFPDDAQVAAGPILGFGPSGVAVLIPSFENTLSITYTWVTGIFQSYSGKEKRLAVMDAPKQVFKGSVQLEDSDLRRIRGALTRYMKSGTPFLFGLPHEGMSLAADSLGTTVYVNPNALNYCDWQQPGQRVIVFGKDGTYANAVLQYPTGGGGILLDKDPGSAGKAGGMIMPAIPMLLDPKQGFQRYAAPGKETWSVTAYAAILEFCPPRAFYTVNAGALAGVTFYARVGGLQGTQTAFTLDVQFLGIGITTEMVEDAPPTQSTTVQAADGIATVGNLRAQLALSSWIFMVGGNDANVLTAADSFALPTMNGGSDAGVVGSGANITMFAGLPVWDRPIATTSGTADDSINALTELVDFDGLPRMMGSVNQPDWGRCVKFTRKLGPEFQWFKLFMFTVMGCQKTFWLPTWRPDLLWVSTDPGGLSIVIDGPDGDSGDFYSWWPGQRSQVQLAHVDGTVSYSNITASTDNHDGTLTLTLDTAVALTDVAMLSWLERCHFDSDDFPVQFTDAKFMFKSDARAVQQ